MKLNKLLLLSLLCFFSEGNNTKGKIEDNKQKIIFENCENLFLGEFSTSDSSDEQYSIMVKLDYEEMKPNQFTNQYEKEIEFDRLKQYYCENNNKIVKKMDLSNAENVYVSKYSNYVSLDANKKNINDVLLSLAEEDNIEKIYVNKIIDVDPNYYNSLEYIDVSNYINNYSQNASGIVVGILEPGIIDSSNINFNGCDVVVRDEWYYKETIEEHTTMMGSIIGGVNGIAKSCKLLSVELSGNAVSEIDWLLENNVNIINCSYGDETPTGKYSSKSAYMDYISYTYKVTFVISAGNTGNTDTYIANPGLAYNALTIGACSSSTGYSRNFSSYKTLEGPRKPNIVAPGYNISIPTFSSVYSGTSYSAAITTGCVALLMKQDSSLKYFPQKVSALLMATAENPDSLYFGSGLDENVGAGVLNYGTAYSTLSNLRLINFTDSTVSYSILYNLSNGDSFRVVTSSLAYSNGDVSSLEYSNYDLYLYDSIGNLIEYQNVSEDCIELLEVKITKNDTYTLKIQKANSTSNSANEYLALSYNIY